MSASISLLYKRDFNYQKLILTNKLRSISDSGNFSCIVINNFLIRPKGIENENEKIQNENEEQRTLKRKCNKKDGYRQQNVRQRQKLISIRLWITTSV